MTYFDFGISKRLFGTKVLAVVAALGLTVGTAAAATFDSGATYSVSHQSGNKHDPFPDSNGNNALYRNVGIFSFPSPTGDNGYESGRAGLFRMTAKNTTSNATQDFLAFCMSPWQYMSPAPNDYEKVSNLATNPSGDALSNEQLGWIGALVHNAWSTVTDTTATLSVRRNNAAAFQIALWEIVSEPAYNATTETNRYDLTDGHFILHSVDGTDVAGMADNLLNNIMLGRPGWEPRATGFALLKHTGSTGTQDLLTVAPVPLPATGLLLLGGFGILAGVKRRKRAA